MPERTTVWISGDQLSIHNTALAAASPSESVVLMIESLARARTLPYHKRKLVLIYAAMREFAKALRAEGRRVDYYAEYEDFGVALAEHIAASRPTRFVFMQQSEYGATERFAALVRSHGLEPEITPHCNFVSEAREFDALLGNKSRITMELFYRQMRKKTGLLVEDGEPVGGAWNFDKENRKPPKRGMTFPSLPPLVQPPSVAEAVAMVEKHFPDHPGEIGTFDIPVTRADALAHLDHFIAYRLDNFGPYEDAMLSGEATLFHSRLSAPINVGLLHPLECARAAVRAYEEKRARLESVEGFVRQLIGWREFVWQIYWRFMPEYRTRNALEADIPVPPFFTSGATSMHCLSEALGHVRTLGWAHHIERLMVIGNFALIAGIDPQACNDWFWYMFVDGYEWVMVPNVIGMTLHADGGIVGTKPYAASANYINGMSDYCKRCPYDPKKAVEDDACPYNALYWDFLDRNRERFERNTRMGLVMKSWSAKDETFKRAVRVRAASLRERLRSGDSL